MSIRLNYPESPGPSLMLDFARTKRLDPRITFSRASSATYYDGKTVAKAEENLLTYSQDFSNIVWGKNNVTVTGGFTAPDGSNTAVKVSGAGSLTRSGFPGTYAKSVWIRSVTGSGQVYVTNGSVASGGTNPTPELITIDTNWQRIERVSVNHFDLFYAVDMRANATLTECYIWGAQAEQRSAVTAYTPTTTQPITNYIPALQTAGAGVARFDHNPVTGESLGLLIEEQRTNLLTNSEAFEAWSQVNGFTQPDVIIAPDGTLTGELFIANITDGQHRVERSAAITSGVTYTFSVYAKFAGIRYVVLRTANDTVAVSFDLINGTQNGGASGSMTFVGNGWYRCAVIGTANATGTAPNRINASNTAGTGFFSGDGYSGIYIWGAQLEAGAFPTSYIKTEASQVTRSADAVSMTGTNFSSWFRQDEGTLYAEALSNSNTFAYIAQLRSTSQSDIDNIYLRKQNTGQSLGAIRIGAAFAFQGTGAAWSLTQSNKLSISYKRNDVAFTDFGGTVTSSSSILVPERINTLGIGVSQVPNSLSLNGTIKKIAYYPARLTNTQLQALSSQ
jgi:hypothetical protein